MGVVLSTHLSKAQQLNSHRRYAGVRRFAHAQQGHHFVQPATHTKAHRELEAILQLSDLEKAVALGNRHVDEQAKQALTLHPEPTALQQSELQAQLRHTKLAMRVLSATLRCFPTDQERKERLPKRQRVPRVHKVGWHNWLKDRCGLRCATCHCLPPQGEALPATGCPGWPNVLRPLEGNHHGHHIRCATLMERGIPLYHCVTCGCWAIRVCKGLRAACPGRAQPGTRGCHNLALIAQGKRPDDRGRLQLPGTLPVPAAPPPPREQHPLRTKLHRPSVGSVLEGVYHRVLAREAAAAAQEAQGEGVA
jgi:hypothetical protein